MLAEKEGYDQTVSLYSPEGRVYQVEYARTASERGGTVVAAETSDGIVLVAIKGMKSELIRSERVEKVHRITDGIVASTSGLIADSRIIVDYLRESAAWYRFTYGEDPRLEDIIPELQELLWIYTEYGGVRPFGVSTIIAGAEGHSLSISILDVTGDRRNVRAGAIGRFSDEINTALEKKYRDDMDSKEAIKLIEDILAEVYEDISMYEIEKWNITDSGAEML